MTQADSKILLASAGTGKTTRLTGRLLDLYASGIAPERILASTFSRKAAGEILQRVISRLYKAGESEAAAAQLSEKLELVNLDRAQVGELACRLLRSIDRVRISTLDAWFLQRVQRASLALGLPEDWELSDEQRERALNARALSRSLRLPRAEGEWSGLIADLKRGGADSRVHSGLLAILGAAAAFARESSSSAWDFPPLSPAVPAAEFDSAVEELRRARAPATQAGKPHASFQDGLAKLRTLLREKSWSKFVEHTAVASVLTGEGKYFGHPIHADLAAAIKVLARRAAAELSGVLRAQNRALCVLAQAFVEELDRARRQERRLPFDALPRLLESLPLDESFDHLLLDEFQDTSSIQWRAIAQSVESAAHERGRSFFCVGDSKQSVYGWRGAEPRLLSELPERLGITPEKLFENHRSSPAVLEAVNLVFESIATNEALEDPAAQRAGEQFQSAFAKHVAAKQELSGQVRLWTAADPGEGALVGQRNGVRIARGVELALEIRRDHPDWTIAFLLRRNTLAPALLEALNKQGVRASGHGGNPLTDSSAVNAALSLFEFADYPGDEYVYFHLATSPLANHLGLQESAGDEERSRIARDLRRRWLESGPTAILDGLAPAVRANFNAFDQRRFAQLVNLCGRLESSAPLRPAEFAARLALERVPDPASAPVQVMTVHGAKGLEFDAVILLDLDSRLSNHEPSLVARREGGDPAKSFDVVTHTLPRKAAAVIPALEEVLVGARAARLEEELCVLYVSMTRAVRRLEMIVDTPRREPAKSTCAGILLRAFAPGSIGPSQLLREFRHAGLEARPTRSAPEAAPTAASAPLLARFGLEIPQRELVHVAPSHLKSISAAATAGGSSRPASFATSDLFRDSRAARARGALWHSWLERIDWSDAALPELALLVSRAGAEDEPRTLLEARAFLAALAQLEVRAELSRAEAAKRLGAGAGELELLREQRFALLRDRGNVRELVQGAFDRAVIARRSGRAEIVDFKTSAIPADECGESALALRARQYEPQLSAYREALAGQCGIAQESIALRVCFVAAGRSVQL